MLSLERAYGGTAPGDDCGSNVVEQNVHVIITNLADRHERHRDLGDLEYQHDVVGIIIRCLQVKIDPTVVGNRVPSPMTSFWPHLLPAEGSTA